MEQESHAMRCQWMLLVTCVAAWSSADDAAVAGGACLELCGEIVVFDDGLAPSREIHVAVGGNNQSGDGSQANPYATIAHAAGQATPGTAVIVHGGTYGGGGFINNLTGAPQAPIWIGGAAGEPRPVINSGGEGLHLVQCAYVVLHDLEVRNAASNGINCDDSGDYNNPLASHHLGFRNLFIHHIGGTGNQDGLKLSGVNDYFVLDCEIAFCGGANSGSGIDHVGCHHGLIARCFFHDLSANAVQCKGGSEDIEIRWCRLTEAGQRGVNIGGSTGFEFFRPPLSTTTPNAEARDIRVVGNIIEGCLASIAFVGCVDSVVADNTIVDPHNWIIRILQETVTGGGYEFLPCANNAFYNNLVYFDRSDLSTHVNIGPNTSPGTFTFANDLWYAHDNPAQSTPNLPTAEVNGIYGIDPELLNPALDDYRITERSATAGAGMAPAASLGDVIGTCYGDPPAIGVFESLPPGDANGDMCVNIDDIFAVIGAWGPCAGTPAFCSADLDGNGQADIDDLFAVVTAWP